MTLEICVENEQRKYDHVMNICASDSCLMLDYVRVINFRIIIIICEATQYLKNSVF